MNSYTIHHVGSPRALLSSVSAASIVTAWRGLTDGGVAVEVRCDGEPCALYSDSNDSLGGRPDVYTMAQLLDANEDESMDPAHIALIAALDVGASVDVDFGASGVVTFRRVG